MRPADRWQGCYDDALQQGMTPDQAQDYADATCVDLSYREELDADEREGR